MKLNSTILAAAIITPMLLLGRAQAQNYPVAHWINSSGQSADAVLSANTVFITDFKGHNDLTVTPTNSGALSLYTDIFGGASSGNNPVYLTGFIGSATNGTGDGTAGNIRDLEMTFNPTGTLQFDFATPLTSRDRILMVDIDGAEQYKVEAYAFNGLSNAPVSVQNWTAENFSGATGQIPDPTWPAWSPTNGILTSQSGPLNEELVVLTPAQNITRLVVSKLNGNSYSTDITFVSLGASLTVKQSGTNAVLSWPGTNYSLQSAPTVIGTYTNVPAASSPYTNSITASNRFFRLLKN